MNGMLAVQRSSSSCEGSIDREAICGSDHLARQRTIQSLKRALQKSIKVCFHLSVQDLETRCWPLGPFDLDQLDFPEGTPLFSLYTALQKELKQITVLMAQMALVVIKVVPKADVDECEQQGKIQSIVDLTSEQVGIVSITGVRSLE